MKALILLLGFWIWILGIVGPAFSDWRPYAYSYSYMTSYMGEKEIEVYTDYDYKGSNYNLKNQIEYEYGITDHWMASAYGVFTGSEKSSYKFSQAKLQTRYRFGEEGIFVVDPAVYLEYKMSTDGGPSTLEFKQILSKNIGDWNTTVNIILKQDLVQGSALEKGYTIGLSKILSGNLNNIRIGVEAKGGLENNPYLYLGPSVAAIWNNLKINLAAGFGATSSSNTMLIRNIVSYEF